MNTARSPEGLIEVSVLIEGISQPIYHRSPDGALFVAGAKGQAYTLRVKNLKFARVEVINTVDGRNTLKDEPGDTNQNKGLVFGASSSGSFTGWRLNNAQTRQFVFSDPHNSVSAKATGSHENTGVIGFAAWREQISTPNHSYECFPVFDSVPVVACAGSGLSSSMSSNYAGSSVSVRSVSHNSSLGTGIGSVQADHVGSTTFTRTGTADVLIIHYDTPEALAAMGITRGASAFPGSGTGYEKY
jgi:hypothetical protein